MHSALTKTLARKHLQRFGAAPSLMAYAPGRVEILGNHTDYNAGLALSAAIASGLAAALRPIPEKVCAIYAADLNEALTLALPVKAPLPKPRWANYVLGVVNQLNAIAKMEHGFQISLAGDIPMGAGLSSSAAMGVAAALALSTCYDLELTKLQIAQLCQAAENEYALTRSGLLDQLSSLYGEPQALLLIDFKTLKVQAIPCGPDISFLIADTGVKHNLAESEYNTRRAQCAAAADFFAQALQRPGLTLRDISQDDWQRLAAGLDPLLRRRAAHILGENQRVLAGCQYLHTGAWRAFGELLFESHQSSRANFENSCRELDVIVAAARALPAVLGARLSGGGFGGSVVLMVDPADAAASSRALAARYQALCGRPCELRAVAPAAGARCWHIS